LRLKAEVRRFFETTKTTTKCPRNPRKARKKENRYLAQISADFGGAETQRRVRIKNDGRPLRPDAGIFDSADGRKDNIFL
jgi:hypothetical protein